MKKLYQILFISSLLIGLILIISICYKPNWINNFSEKNNSIHHSNLPVLEVKNEQRTFDPDENTTIKIYEDLNASVVNITSYKTEYIRYFFDIYPEKSEGQGSGAIIDARGYIVTNYHVIGDADKVSVSIPDIEGVFDAEIIGVDPENDLAVIKVKNFSANLKMILLGNSNDLKVGQKVYAIGNPFGLDRTLTTGIISGLGRPIKTESGSVIEGAIQTDASINPGNSGGPLIDSTGRMIGINTMIISPSGGSVGLGFAIPVDTVKETVAELIKFGYVKRGWIDATFLPITPQIAKQLGYNVNAGLMIMVVSRNGEAYKSGLRGGDRKAIYGNKIIYVDGEIITGIDSIKITDYSSLVQVLKNKKPGETIQVEYYKDNRKKSTQIKLIDKRQFTGEY